MINRTIAPVVWLLATGAAWSLVYDLIVVRNVGTTPGFWAPLRLASYLAFILAPAITFIPIARRLHIPLYDLEAIAGWSTLAFILAFIDPGSNPPMPAVLMLLVSLTIALATVFTLLSYAVGLRLLARRSQRYDFVRARRDGYVLAIFVVGLALLGLLKAFSPATAALLGLIVLLLELFLLSRSGSRS